MQKSTTLVSVHASDGANEPVTNDESVYELAPLPAYDAIDKKGAQEPEIIAVQTPDTASDNFDKSDNPDQIIVTGADAAAHLLPLRDDGDPSVTFRGIFLASCLSAFQAVMNQIYTVSHSIGYRRGWRLMSSSSNQLQSPFKVPSSSSLPILLAMHGQSFSLEATVI